MLIAVLDADVLFPMVLRDTLLRAAMLDLRRDAAIGRRVEDLFSEDFAGQILVFDEQAARSFSQIAAKRRGRGRPMAELDAQIAAIAHVHGAALATRNIGDFEGCGVKLMNPWLD